MMQRIPVLMTLVLAGAGAAYGVLGHDAYANPAVIPIAGVADGSGGFEEMDGADGIAIAQISGKTYAVVTGWVDNGTQIIDITNPAAPAPVAAISDDAGGFTTLSRANEVAIAAISDRTYAVVVSSGDQGVQIIDITDPAMPTPTAAILDDAGGFTTLDIAADVAIASISGRTYAVVPSYGDHGVQIINITNPAMPTPTAAVTDDIGGFTTLKGANEVAITTISNRTYAVVASYFDDGIQIIDITNPAMPTPTAAATDNTGGFTALEGPEDGIAIAEISGRVYATVTSHLNYGVQIIDITNPAMPAPVAAVTDESCGFTALEAPRDIAIAAISDRVYAIAAGSADDGVQIIDITNPAMPAPVAAITDRSSGFSNLKGADEVAIAEISGKMYAVVTAFKDDGIQIMDISALSESGPIPSKCGFYTNLNATITITDYQRTEYGADSLIRITADIANHDRIILTAQNAQRNYVDGETLIYLGGTMPPPAKGTEFGGSVGYGDVSYRYLQGSGANIAPQDCTSEDAWADINPASTKTSKMCFWVPYNFTPDGLLLAVYDVLTGEAAADMSDVIIRAQVTPFTADSAYCADNYEICDIDMVQSMDGDTYTNPHRPYATYIDLSLLE